MCHRYIPCFIKEIAQSLFHFCVRDSDRDFHDPYGSSCNHAFLKLHGQELQPVQEDTLLPNGSIVVFLTIVACYLIIQTSCNLNFILPLFKFLITALLFLLNVNEMEKAVTIKALTTKKEFS
jgi:hypothetical protein